VKSPPDTWWMSFTYDAVHDVVDSAFRDVILETEEDVLCWRREVEKRFARFGRPVDLIIDLEGLIVKPSAARAFGAHRAEVLAANTRVSYRFNGNLQTRTSIYTSAVIHGADANIYESREEALRALLANRQTINPLSVRPGPLSQRPAGTAASPSPLSPRPAPAPADRPVPGPLSYKPPPADRPAASPSGPVSLRPPPLSSGGPVSQRPTPAPPGPVSQRPPAIATGPVSQPSTPIPPAPSGPSSTQSPPSPLSQRPPPTPKR
jgi:hypothetical protein